jgi:hypothetical protein
MKHNDLTLSLLAFSNLQRQNIVIKCNHKLAKSHVTFLDRIRYHCQDVDSKIPPTFWFLCPTNMFDLQAKILILLVAALASPLSFQSVLSVGLSALNSARWRHVSHFSEATVMHSLLSRSLILSHVQLHFKVLISYSYFGNFQLYSDYLPPDLSCI